MEESKKGTLRALLVEDNEINAEIAMMQLRSFGFDVEWVSNGARAVECFGDSALNHFAIIIMDLMMPVMDGVEATGIIRGLDREDAKNVPIIATTANAYPEDQKILMDKGVNLIITKPYSKDDLYEAVTKLTEGSENS